MAGQYDDGNVGLRTHVLHELQSYILVGKLEIENHQVDGLIGETRFIAFLLAAKLTRKLSVFQVTADDIAHGRVVIHYELTCFTRTP